MMNKKPYPVRVVAATSGTKVLMVSQTDFRTKFDVRDKEKIRDQLSSVTFPSLEEVIRDIDILKQVQSIKKAAFMNACDTNIIARDMRDSIIDDSKVLKRIKWV